MKTIVNYYCLTKKELSFVSFCEAPVISSVNGRRLSTPVVLRICKSTNKVTRVLTLSYFKWCVKRGILINGYEYHIHAMF